MGFERWMNASAPGLLRRRGAFESGFLACEGALSFSAGGMLQERYMIRRIGVPMISCVLSKAGLRLPIITLQ